MELVDAVNVDVILQDGAIIDVGGPICVPTITVPMLEVLWVSVCWGISFPVFRVIERRPSKTD